MGIGKYGTMAVEYMKQTDFSELEYLVINGDFEEYFSSINEEAFSRKEIIITELKKQTPPPKTDSFIEFAKYNNWLYSTAEELVLSEIVYV